MNCWATVEDSSVSEVGTSQLCHLNGVMNPWEMYRGDAAIRSVEKGSVITLLARRGTADPHDRTRGLNVDSVPVSNGTEAPSDSAATRPQRTQTNVGIAAKPGWIVAIAGARAAGLRRSHRGDRRDVSRVRIHQKGETPEAGLTEVPALDQPLQRGGQHGPRAFSDPTERRKTARGTTMLVLRTPSGWRITALK